MNKHLLWLKLALIGVLGLSILGARSCALLAWKRQDALLTQPVNRDYQPRKLPELARDTHSINQFAAVVERPLFVQGRQPVVAEQNTNTPSDTASQTPTAGPLHWELTGIYYDGTQLRALLRNKQQRANQPKVQKLALDQEVDGWRIIDLKPDRLILESAGQQQSLILQKPKAKQANLATQTPSLAESEPAPVKDTSKPLNPFAASIAEAQKRLANKKSAKNDKP
ncbi:MAG: hypothetical protein RQ715_02105 [Methylococcales bacterium]|nr:hypothetical protein [Methylococcales bacterium]